MKFNRVAIALGGLILIQVALIIAMVIGEKRQHLDKAMQKASEMALVARSVTDDYFNRYIAIFDALKSVDPIRQQDRNASSIILQRLNKRFPEVVNFAAVKKDGDFFASGKPMSGYKTPNIMHLGFFQRLSSGEKLVIMQPHKGPISNERVTGIVVPFKDVNGQFNGLIGVSVMFQNLVARWENLIADTTAIMVVHDKDGVVHFDSAGIKEQKTNLERILLAHTGGKISLKQRPYALHTIAHADSGWNISMFVPAHIAFADLVLNRKELIFLFGLMLFTIVALFIWHFEGQRLNEQLVGEQEKLKWSEAIFRQFAENINAVFWVSPPDKSSISYVSPKFEKIWGKTCQALYENSWLWVDTIHSEDKGRVQTAVLEKQAKGTYNEQYRIVRDDGAVRWIHDRAFPVVDVDGHVYRLVGIAEDITEVKLADQALKESEERFKRALANIPDVVVIYGTDLKIRYINEATQRITGLQAHDFIGKREEDLWPPEVYEKYLPTLKEAFECGEIQSVETEIALPGSQPAYLMVTCVPLLNESGDVHEVLGITHDLTEGKRYENELKNFAVYLQNEIEKERIAISREIHDDLGQTMSALKLDIGWIKRRVPPEQFAVVDKLDSMAGMIKDSVQTIKRICSELRPGILDDMGLEPGLEWLVANFRMRNEIECSLEASNLEREIPSDIATAIYRIAQEALTNVSRHAKATHVWVGIDSDDAEYRLEVVDNGVGGSSWSTSKAGSFGIVGMRERTAALGGRFSIDSRPGNGTTIRVRLPKQAA